MIQSQLELDHEGEAGVLGDVIVISRHLINRVREIADNWDPITLYTFYYYTAKWQKSNITKATTAYVAKGLRWSVERVQKNKNVLRELNLIKDVRRTDKGKVTGYYVKVCFMWAEKNHPTEKPGGGENQALDFSTPNALSKSKGNALSKSKINASQENRKIDWDSVKDEWNRLAKKNRFPTIARMTEDRKRKYKAITATKEDKKRFWEVLELELPRMSEFAHGETPDGTWVLSFDFVIHSEQNFTKVEERKYLDKKYLKPTKKKAPQGRRLDLMTREEILAEE